MTAAALSCHCPVVLTPPSPAPLLPAAPTAPDGKQLLPRQDERPGRLAPNPRPTAWLMIARTPGEYGRPVRPRPRWQPPARARDHDLEREPLCGGFVTRLSSPRRLLSWRDVFPVKAD